MGGQSGAVLFVKDTLSAQQEFRAVLTNIVLFAAIDDGKQHYIGL